MCGNLCKHHILSFREIKNQYNTLRSIKKSLHFCDKNVSSLSGRDDDCNKSSAFIYNDAHEDCNKKEDVIC